MLQPRQVLAAFFVTILVWFAAPLAAFADQAPIDPAADAAIDVALQTANTAGDLNLSGDETKLLKSVMECAIQGGSDSTAVLENCGRKVLVDQLGKLPPPAAAFTDCMMNKGKLETCGQQAVIKTLSDQIPDPSVAKIATCVANAGLNGNVGAAGDCARTAVVAQIPDPNVAKIADCLLQQKKVADCAASGLIAQLPSNFQPAAECLVAKQDPTQCAAKIAQAGGLDKLPPELTCLSNQATAQSCLQQKIVDRLPVDQSQKDLAKCMMDPAQAAQCALKQLPPNIADTANCIATQQNPAHCAALGAKAAGLDDPLALLNKMMGNPQLVDPGHAASSLPNLLKIADGIRNDKWDEVIQYGGVEMYKIAAHAVLNYILPSVFGPAGELLAKIGGPIVDTMVQDRVELFNALMREARACAQGHCDEAKIGEILGEFYLLLNVEVPCALIGEISAKLQDTVCSAAGKLIMAVGDAGYQFYNDNDKALAAAAVVYLGPAGPLVAAGILLTDRDVGKLLSGTPDCPTNYFGSNMAVCYKKSAYLSFTDPGAAARFDSDMNQACRHAFLNCSQEIGGSDSKRISEKCDPLMNSYRKTAAAVASDIAGLAAQYAAADFKMPVDACTPQIGNMLNDFVNRCAAALPAKYPGYNDPRWNTCPGADPNPDALTAACRAAGIDKIREQQRGILAARGVQSFPPPARTASLDQPTDIQFQILCGSCNQYGSRAVQQANENLNTHCSQTGPRWSTDFMQHKQWCLTAPRGEPEAETRARDEALVICRACQDYSDRAMKSARTNATYDCHGAPPELYSLDPTVHIQFCRSSQPVDMSRANDTRHIFLDKCLRDYTAANTPAVTAPGDCVPVTVVNPADCGDPNQRRGANGVCFSCSHDAHFDDSGRCALCSPGFHAINGDICVSDRAQPVKPACTVLAPPRPVMLPLPLVTCPGDLRLIGTQCKCPDGTQGVGNNRCVATSNGTPIVAPPAFPPRLPINPPPSGPGSLQPQIPAATTPGQPTKPPPIHERCDFPLIGFKPVCVCPQGQQRQGNGCTLIHERCDFPLIGFKPVCACPQGQQRQGNGCALIHERCDFPFVGFKPECACPQGQQRQGNGCALIHERCDFPFVGFKPECACPQGQQQQGNSCTTPIHERCDSPFLGTKPNCKCPLGSLGTPPMCCLPGQQVVNGRCVAPPPPTTCPANRPVGTPPNCCPRGRVAKGGLCVSSCPPGYTVLDAPNKYGSFCEAPAQPKQCNTAAGEILYPDGNCACPPGTGRYGPNHSCAKPPATTSPTPVGPAPKHCTRVVVCDAFGKGAPGTLSGPCIKSHTELDCGPPVQGPK